MNVLLSQLNNLFVPAIIWPVSLLKFPILFHHTGDPPKIGAVKDMRSIAARPDWKKTPFLCCAWKTGKQTVRSARTDMWPAAASTACSPPPAQRAKWLQRLQAPSDGIEQSQRVDAALDQVAEELERCLDLDAVLAIARNFQKN